MIAMNLDFIDQAAEKIQQQLRTGEVFEACCMSAVSTPVTESWEVTQELVKENSLTSVQQQVLLRVLSTKIQQQLNVTGFDDFDLIYERLLQLVFQNK